MKTLKFLLPFLLLFTVVSCSDDDDMVGSEEQGGVANVMMVSSSAGANPVKIGAIAIGFNGCWSNLRLDLKKESTFKYTLKSYGTVAPGDACTQGVVQVDQEVSFTPTAQGTYEITVYNSPTETSVKTVDVIYTR